MLESVTPTDQHGRDAFDFCNLSGCEQLVSCLTHIAGNRLDLVMTDVPDMVDVVVGTPLCTSDQCFVSSVFCVEQSVPEYSVKSTVFLNTVPTVTVLLCSQEPYLEQNFEDS